MRRFLPTTITLVTFSEVSGGIVLLGGLSRASELCHFAALVPLFISFPLLLPLGTKLSVTYVSVQRDKDLNWLHHRLPE